MNNLKKSTIQILVLIIAMVFVHATVFGQSENINVKNSIEHSELEMMKSSPSQMPDSIKSIVREEPIEVESLDINKDGKIFQGQMDWNVISDEPGDCPLCGMKLKEVSIDEAKANLVKNGFAIKSFKSERKKIVDSNNSKKSIWNKYCPVSGMKINFGSETVDYDGKTIGFCCPSKEHNKVFLEDPEKYIKNLSIDGQTFIGNEQK